MRRLLEDVPVRAGLEPTLQQRPLAVGGEDEDTRVGGRAWRSPPSPRCRPSGACAVSMIAEVGTPTLGEGHGRLAVRRLADDADVRRPQQRQPQTLAHDLVVVRDQDSDLAAFRHGEGFYERGETPPSALTARTSCSGSGAGSIGGRRGRHVARARARTADRTGSVSAAGR